MKKCKTEIYFSVRQSPEEGLSVDLNLNGEPAVIAKVLTQGLPRKITRRILAAIKEQL